MNKMILSAAALLGSTLAAAAADLPLRAAPVAMAPVFSWTGLYVGLQAGYYEQEGSRVDGTPLFGSAVFAAGAINNTAIASSVTGQGHRASGPMAGAQIGYNFQFGRLVVGVEGDAMTTYTGQRSAHLVRFPLPPFAVNGTTEIVNRQRYNYLLTLRARLGFLVTDSLLVYATGGVIHGELQRRFTTNTTYDVGLPLNFIIPGFGVRDNSSVTRTGYTIGGGAEYRLDASWSVKAEGLYYDMGRSTRTTQFNSFTSFTAPPSLFTTTGVTSTTRHDGWMGRVGLNYKFNWL
jgi:outer membrane immunogenic protein